MNLINEFVQQPVAQMENIEYQKDIIVQQLVVQFEDPNIYDSIL